MVTVTPNPVPLGTSHVQVNGTGFGAYRDPRPEAVNGGVYYGGPADIALSGPIPISPEGTFNITYNRLWHIPDAQGSPFDVYDNAGKVGAPLARVLVQVV
jgi:hypothetical protein